MDDDISPFIGQKRADILRGVKEFMDRGKQEGARGMICVMIAFGDAAKSHLSFRSASGALCMAEVAEFGALALGEIVAHLKKSPSRRRYPSPAVGGRPCALSGRMIS